MAKAHSPNCPFWVLFRRDNLAIFRAMCYAIGKKNAIFGRTLCVEKANAPQ